MKTKGITWADITINQQKEKWNRDEIRIKEKFQEYNTIYTDRPEMNEDGLFDILVAGGRIPSSNPLQFIKAFCKKHQIKYLNKADNIMIGIKSNVMKIQFDSAHMARKLVETLKDFNSSYLPVGFDAFRDMAIIGASFNAEDKVSDKYLRQELAPLEQMVGWNYYIWNQNKKFKEEATGRLQVYIATKEAGMKIINQEKEITIGQSKVTFYLLYTNTWDTKRDVMATGFGEISEFIVTKWIKKELCVDPYELLFFPTDRFQRHKGIALLRPSEKDLLRLFPNDVPMLWQCKEKIISLKRYNKQDFDYHRFNGRYEASVEPDPSLKRKRDAVVKIKDSQPKNSPKKLELLEGKILDLKRAVDCQADIIIDLSNSIFDNGRQCSAIQKRLDGLQGRLSFKAI